MIASTAVNNDWVLDSGSSSHFSNSKASLTNFSPDVVLTDVTTAGGSKLPVVGKGTIYFGNNTIPKVLYVPTIRSNLLSVGSFADNGHTVWFNAKHCFIMQKTDPTKVYLTGSRDPVNHLYTLSLPAALPKSTASACAVFDDDTTLNQIEQLWHRRLGHPNYQRLYHMSTLDLTLGLPKLNLVNCHCTSCLLGKQQRKPLPKLTHVAVTRPLQRVHSDLCGIFSVQTLTNSKYFITFIDEFTRYCGIYFLAKKSEAFFKFKIFRNNVENLLNSQIGELRSDRG
jgi:hypothetical protein